MKKLSKKQKVIGLVSVILVFAILTIIIATSIIRKDKKIAGEDYFVTTANAESALIAGYIKKGITIGGITGTLEVLDTSDATAYPEDIAYGKIAYARGERIVGTRAEIITDLDPNEVYYADIEGDGIVDGVIFADLAVGESGQWGDAWGNYTIPKESNLKEYYIKEESYTDDFGTGKVLSPIKEKDGNDRFYVMALDDFDSSMHYWYCNAYNKLDSSYSVGKSENDFAEAGGQPIGKVNTERMIASWNMGSGQYGDRNENDMWGIIQKKDTDGKSKIEKGWFVPSKSEWVAFGARFNIDRTNYSSDFKLSNYYWSSAQGNTMYAYYVYFEAGFASNSNVNNSFYVRLATTF